MPPAGDVGRNNMKGLTSWKSKKENDIIGAVSIAVDCFAKTLDLVEVVTQRNMLADEFSCCTTGPCFSNLPAINGSKVPLQ
jgi:hypothetical protein